MASNYSSAQGLAFFAEPRKYSVCAGGRDHILAMEAHVDKGLVLEESTRLAWGMGG